MNYLSVAQIAEKWDMTPRRVQVLCNEGRIVGAQQAKAIVLIQTFPLNECGLCQTKIHLTLSLYML